MVWTFFGNIDFLLQAKISKSKSSLKKWKLLLRSDSISYGFALKNILVPKKFKIFDLLFSKPKSGLADLWSLMEDKGRSGMIKTFLQVYSSNSNNNLSYVPYTTDVYWTLALYKATRPNLARPEGWKVNFCQDLCPEPPWLTAYWFYYSQAKVRGYWNFALKPISQALCISLGAAVLTQFAGYPILALLFY